ncbi:AAA family ATPase [Pelagimonas sp. KU-00592-HH]
MLIDPTSDHPEDHLAFDMNGIVYGETDKGNTTISVLGLNRPHLVAARRDRLRQFEALLKAARGASDSKGVAEELEMYVSDKAPFAGMMRQLVLSKHIQDLIQQALQDDFQTQLGRMESHGTERTNETTEDRVGRARASREDFISSKSGYSFGSAQGLADFRTFQPLIERIELTNIRAIRNLDLVLGSETQDLRSWLMLLGENGTGKSTVLQSVALALSGYDQVQRLIEEKWIEPGAMVRSGCDHGQIAVRLSGFSEAHILSVYPDRLEFLSPQGDQMTIYADGRRSGTGWEAQTLVLAYGATRLMAGGAEMVKAGGQYSRIDNLFHSFVPLIDAQTWLLGLDDMRYQTACDILRDLLDLDESAKIEPNEDRTEIVIKWPGETVRMKDLSDGFRTVLAMAADMLDVLSRIWPDLSEAVGVVLVDELDSHLHPTWQMKIVSALRKALGGVQFLATTHQPLCLRGLTEGEVVVMRRDQEGLIDPLTDLPSPAELRVDQLLTSDFFGLKSTIDPDVEAMFDQYYALLALSELTEAQEAERSQLEEALKSRQQMGNSQRETLFYSAIDKLLAQQDTSARQAPQALEQEVADQIGSMWQNALRNAGIRR